MPELVWYRSDLRTIDAEHLSAACERSSDVHACFMITPGQWRRHGIGSNHVEYLRRSLEDLGSRLAELNIPLHVRTVAEYADVPGVVRELVAETGSTAVHWGREYGVNELARDDETRAALAETGAEVIEHDTQWVARPGSIRTGTDGPYKVFTPYLKSWRTALPSNLASTGRHRPEPRPGTRPKAAEIPARIEGFVDHVDLDDWPIGEIECLAALDRFLTERAGAYGRDRDIPSIEGTSRLGPALACGVLSPRGCVLAARECMKNDDNSIPGTETWVSEIAWRDFYRNIMFEFPRVSMDRAFRPETEDVAWLDDDDLFAAWCEGRTGYPIVDAAMRALVATGWMHNRLRMVTSQFLTKHLLTDWRSGESFFARHLVDFDFASNNGGWQWSASTGTDSAPYFRVFNPTAQGKRFDPDGVFIRRWVPELADLGKSQIHEPQRRGGDLWNPGRYPEPVVDQSDGRKRAIQAFADLKKK